MYDHILKNRLLTDLTNGFDCTKMDIAVFNVDNREISFPDARGVEVRGSSLLVPAAKLEVFCAAFSRKTRV